MDNSPVKRFFDLWSIYELVLEYNYMFHNEIFRDIAALFDGRFDRPFSMMDLGCGSARHVSRVLQETSVARYVGCDLSEVALGRARENLKPLNAAVELRQADLSEALQTGAEQFDVVFSSYALHHLKQTDKAGFFALAHQRLTPEGLLLLVDTSQEEDETRESSIEAYCRWINSDWTKLPADARELIFQHIRTADYPEKSSTLHELAERNRFNQRRNLNAFLWHRTWCFAKWS